MNPSVTSSNRTAWTVYPSANGAAWARSPFAGAPVPRAEPVSAKAELTNVLASLYSGRPRPSVRRRNPRHADPVNAAVVLGLTAIAQLLFFAIMALTGT